MKRNATEIFSIFGQIEEVAAQVMIDKGQATKIDAKDIPPTAAFNDQGQSAKFAVVVPGDNVRAFNELIANLRA